MINKVLHTEGKCIPCVKAENLKSEVPEPAEFFFYLFIQLLSLNQILKIFVCLISFSFCLRLRATSRSFITRCNESRTISVVIYPSRSIINSHSCVSIVMNLSNCSEESDRSFITAARICFFDIFRTQLSLAAIILFKAQNMPSASQPRRERSSLNFQWLWLST